jgi:thioredoxin 1
MKNKKKGKIKMALLKINNENFESEVLNSNKTVLLDFYADWCGPCQMVAPVLAEIAEEREDIVVGKINVDEEMQLALKFGVESIPMIAVIKDGKLVNKSVGFRPKEQILELL